MPLTMTVLIATVACGFGAGRNSPQDLSHKEEQKLLERLAPTLYVSPFEGGIQYPLSVTWWAERAQLRVPGKKDAIGDLNAEKILTQVKEAGDEAKKLKLTLRRKDEDEQNHLRAGRTKDKKAEVEPTVYGFVDPREGENDDRNVVRVAYFYFFGANHADPLPDAVKWLPGDNHPGFHEGDWCCVDFDVDVSNPDRPLIKRAIYHNHGRQIFVDNPDKNIVDNEGRPRVYVEDGTHEAWPFSGGGEGFAELDEVPAWVWTNNKLDMSDKDICPVLGVAAEALSKGDLAERQVCRGHDGKEKVSFKRVVNVGHKIPKDAGPEVRLFHEFSGDWGEEHNDGGENPRGPPHNSKMWERKGWKNGEKEDVRGTKK